MEERLTRDFVVGAFLDERLAAIAGLTRFTDEKLAHKSLLWGMNLKAELRGTSVADKIMSSLGIISNELILNSVMLCAAEAISLDGSVDMRLPLTTCVTYKTFTLI